MPVQPFKPFTVNLGSLGPNAPQTATTRLALSPSLTETWSIEALIFNIATRYKVRYETVYGPVFEAFAAILNNLIGKENALLNRKSSLAGQIVQAEKAVTESEAGEAGLPPGKELDNQQVQTSQARAALEATRAEAHNNEGEIEAVRIEKHTIEKDRLEWGLADGFAAIEAPTLDLLMVVTRGGETVFIDHLQTTRVLSLVEWRTNIGAEHQFDDLQVEGQVIESGVGRISFPIPVILGPGETLAATLTVNILNPKRPGSVETINRGVGISVSNVPEPGELVPIVRVPELAAAYTEQTPREGAQP